MAKDKSLNPAAAQRKADKQREIARSKRQVQAQRNEKLARRNPERLQRQIDSLKALEQEGTLRAKDKETLAQLERDVRGIQRARQAVGYNSEAQKDIQQNVGAAHKSAREQQQERHTRQYLGKRRRGEDDVASTGYNPNGVTDPDVLNIPMPRDTPPPFPQSHKVLSGASFNEQNAAAEAQATPSSKKVYSSAPQIRDLRKEATKFTPAVVSILKKKCKGEGKLLEPEEIDRLEKSGYLTSGQPGKTAGNELNPDQIPSAASAVANHSILDYELEQFEQEISHLDSTTEAVGLHDASKRVYMEEVEDDGD